MPHSKVFLNKMRNAPFGRGTYGGAFDDPSCATHHSGKRHRHMWRRARRPFLRDATEISLCAALAKAHASNCDGDNRYYERP